MNYGALAETSIGSEPVGGAYIESIPISMQYALVTSLSNQVGVIHDQLAAIGNVRGNTYDLSATGSILRLFLIDTEIGLKNALSTTLTNKTKISNEFYYLFSILSKVQKSTSITTDTLFSTATALSNTVDTLSIVENAKIVRVEQDTLLVAHNNISKVFETKYKSSLSGYLMFDTLQRLSLSSLGYLDTKTRVSNTRIRDLETRLSTHNDLSAVVNTLLSNSSSHLRVFDAAKKISNTHHNQYYSETSISNTNSHLLETVLRAHRGISTVIDSLYVNSTAKSVPYDTVQRLSYLKDTSYGTVASVANSIHSRVDTSLLSTLIVLINIRFDSLLKIRTNSTFNAVGKLAASNTRLDLFDDFLTIRHGKTSISDVLVACHNNVNSNRDTKLAASNNYLDLFNTITKISYSRDDYCNTSVICYNIIRFVADTNVVSYLKSFLWRNIVSDLYVFELNTDISIDDISCSIDTSVPTITVTLGNMDVSVGSEMTVSVSQTDFNINIIN